MYRNNAGEAQPLWPEPFFPPANGGQRSQLVPQYQEDLDRQQDDHAFDKI